METVEGSERVELNEELAASDPDVFSSSVSMYLPGREITGELVDKWRIDVDADDEGSVLVKWLKHT